MQLLTYYMMQPNQPKYVDKTNIHPRFKLQHQICKEGPIRSYYLWMNEAQNTFLLLYKKKFGDLWSETETIK